MGFSYNYLGLCCDFCSNSGPKQNVRKIKCPFDYCQDWACCNTCKKKKLHLQSSCNPNKISHKDYCKQKMIESNQHKQELQTLLNDGYFIRCSALNHGDKVKVLFYDKDQNKKACFMTHEAYHKISLGTNAKIEDYEIISMAKNTDINDPEITEVLNL